MKYLLVAALLFVTATIHAQSPRTVNTRQMIWAGLSGDYKFNQIWSAGLDGQFRFEFADGDIYQWLVRAYAACQAGNGLRFSAGAAYGRVYPNPNGKVARPEWRPWQEIGRKWLIGIHHTLYPRVRFEQRFIREYAGSELADDFTLTYRLRLRTDYNYLIRSDSGEQKWSLIAGEEIMFNQKPDGFSGFDQNRVWGGIAYKFAPSNSVNLLYMHVWQQRNHSLFDQFHVIRITWQFIMDRKKGQKK